MNKKYYNFPKGKVNQGEPGVKCAIREVWEEIGMDIKELIREECIIEYSVKKEQKTFYVVSGVNENYKFNPNHNTRGEIGSIVWMSLKEFENRVNEDKFSLVKPFFKPLKRFIEIYNEKVKSKQVNGNVAVADDDLDNAVVQQRMEDLFNKSQNLNESPEVEAKSQAKSTDEIDQPIIVKVNSSGLASCPEGSVDGEGVSSSSDTDDVHSRVEKRVQVFAEELERKFIESAAALKKTLDTTCPSPGTLGSANPFREPFKLSDCL